MNIVVLDDFDRMFAQSPRLEPLHQLGTVTIYTEPAPSEADLLQRLRTAEVIIANRERTQFTRSLLAQLPHLRLIAQTGHGLAHIDLDAAGEFGVEVRVTHGGSVQSVVELALGLMLACMRTIPLHDCRLREGHWHPEAGRELHGKRLGILGLGSVGTALVPVAQALGMNIVAWGRQSSTKRAAGLGVQVVADLDDLLPMVDVVSIHLRSTPATDGLLDARRLALLRPGAVLINTSRGAIVDETALVAALSDGCLAAGLDVFQSEPLPPDHPFRTLDNVVLTPHIGWVTHETYDRFISGCVENVLAFLA